MTFETTKQCVLTYFPYNEKSRTVEHFESKDSMFLVVMEMLVLM